MNKRAIVTGGAGFIGSNTVARLMHEGWSVLVLDNLSRKGSERNLEWLQTLGEFDFEKIDLTNATSTRQAIDAYGKVSGVIHLAGQVAVTTSLVDPVADFETNLRGTLNVLEAIRATGRKPPLIFASTNKVYGSLEWVKLEQGESRWNCLSHPSGIDEEVPLDFHSPYGCSKGGADQYVHDYGRCYGLPTAVLRQSCILGPRQFGVEDQGWVAWFLIATMLDRPLTIYGDGKQVRDLLWVEDLVDLYIRLMSQGEKIGAVVYNVGGGAERTMSLRELIAMAEGLADKKISPANAVMRTGDQLWFVADTAKVTREVGWKPTTSRDESVKKLWAWLGANRGMIEQTIGHLQTKG